VLQADYAANTGEGDLLRHPSPQPATPQLTTPAPPGGFEHGGGG